MDYSLGSPSYVGASSFPLTSLSARALACALAVDRAARPAPLAAALLDDPYLARWAVDARRANGLPSVETAAQMALWLASALPALAQPSQAPAELPDGDRVLAAARLAWAAAGCARELAAPVGPETAARAAWQALVANGIETSSETSAVAELARIALSHGGLDADRAELWACAERWQAQAALQAERWQSGDANWATCLAGLRSAEARLTELEQRFDEALRDAKLAALKAFAYGAGHEINNPLANIASRAQSLLADESHPERRRKLAAINAQAFRGHEMLADLMLFARPPELAPQTLELRALLAEVATHFEPQAREQGTALVLASSPDPLTVSADPLQLRVALLALVRNALEALGGGGQVTLEALRAASPSGESAVLAVHDTGPGIPTADLGRVFDPFYSGREAGRGLGFGLPKAWRIVQQHGGRLEARSEFGRGATFRIWLPCSAPQADGTGREA